MGYLSPVLQDDTISINHNWVNGCNVAHMWHFLQQELDAVHREVSQWKDSMPDWHHHCQVGGSEGWGRASQGLGRHQSWPWQLCHSLALRTGAHLPFLFA